MTVEGLAGKDAAIRKDKLKYAPIGNFWEHFS